MGILRTHRATAKHAERRSKSPHQPSVGLGGWENFCPMLAKRSGLEPKWHHVPAQDRKKPIKPEIGPNVSNTSETKMQNKDTNTKPEHSLKFHTT